MPEIGLSGQNARSPEHEHELDRRLNAASGGVLLIWVGATLLARAGWGIGLVGVGVVLLGEQLARQKLAIKWEKSWVVAGFLLLVGGVVVLVGLVSSLVPVLLIIVGIALLGSTVRRI